MDGPHALRRAQVTLSSTSGASLGVLPVPPAAVLRLAWCAREHSQARHLFRHPVLTFCT